MSVAEFEVPSATINDLPEEVLRHLLSLLSPYGDLKSAMLVCRYWSVLVIEIIQQKYAHFKKSINDGTVYASHFMSENESGAGCTITERYSHCACYFDNDKAMYVFGGCTSPSTTINDLWRFDLTPKQWIRPLAMGIYPSPKACASMVVHKNNLILFGGWSQPTPFPLHQAARFFSELHIYSTQTNRWSHVPTHRPPPPTAGHSASIIEDQMIVFGGSHGHNNSCNDLWVLDIKQMTWFKKEVSDARIRPRYRQSQIVLDNTHILIIGGCGGPNMVYNDIWLLELGDKWTWKEMTVNDSENGPPQPWCRQMCRVGDKVVTVSKGFRPSKDQPGFQIRARPSRTWVPPTQEETQRNTRQKRTPAESSDSSSDESCVNGRMGSFRPPPSRSHGASLSSTSSLGATSSLSAELNTGAAPLNRNWPGFPVPSREHTHPGGPSIRPNATNNRQKQIEMLNKYENLLKMKTQAQSKQPDTDMRNQNPMYLHVLDVSGAVSEGVVTWLPVSECPCEAMETSEEVLFYSLVEGRGELLMFGGLRTDPKGMTRSSLYPNPVTITNDLFLFMPERLMI
ncbi:F-box only protein 42-like [Lineus longissimus]|uniref:F-box only protein 42-like n=1 Tax=Lineus longissimus TaxID=88925 RepID=UPI002B4E4ECE